MRISAVLTVLFGLMTTGIAAPLPISPEQVVKLEKRTLGWAKQCLRNINVYCKNNPATVLVGAGACSKMADYYVGLQASVDAAEIIRNELDKKDKSQWEKRCESLERQFQELQQQNNQLNSKWSFWNLFSRP
jgi:hypothetical protein